MMVINYHEKRRGDKQSQDYLETIRENEQLLTKGRSRARKNQIMYHESDDSYESARGHGPGGHLKIHNSDAISEGGGISR